jgi:hypothetical protein
MPLGRKRIYSVRWKEIITQTVVYAFPLDVCIITDPIFRRKSNTNFVTLRFMPLVQ